MGIMFDFLRRRTAKEFVEEAREKYGLPEPKENPKMPEVVPPKEKNSTVFYRFGVTDNNRVAFSMGYSEITMNKAGCQQMIDQLTFFMNQLSDADENQTAD
jgi:hypothetical protein